VSHNGWEGRGERGAKEGDRVKGLARAGEERRRGQLGDAARGGIAVPA